MRPDTTWDENLCCPLPAPRKSLHAHAENLPRSATRPEARRLKTRYPPRRSKPTAHPETGDHDSPGAHPQAQNARKRIAPIAQKIEKNHLRKQLLHGTFLCQHHSFPSRNSSIGPSRPTVCGHDEWISCCRFHGATLSPCLKWATTRLPATDAHAPACTRQNIVVRSPSGIERQTLS